MVSHKPSGRATFRAIVVVAIALFFLIAYGLDLRRLWSPMGVFGFQTNGDGVVNAVQDGPVAYDHLESEAIRALNQELLRRQPGAQVQPA